MYLMGWKLRVALVVGFLSRSLPVTGTTAPESIVDCDGNAIDDAVETEPLRLRAGLEFPIGSYTSDSVAADFDGDGDLDIVANDYRPPITSDSPIRVKLLRNDGYGRFGAPEPVDFGQEVGYLASGDFDGDGSVDLAASVGNAVILTYNQGDGRFERIRRMTLPEAVGTIEGSDLDGDGDTDLVVGGRARAVRWAPVVEGELQPFQDVAGVSGGVHPADLDGDGDLDLLLDGATGFAENLGNAIFAEPRSLIQPAAGERSGAAVAADFNADGHLDLAVVHLETSRSNFGYIRVEIADGEGNYTTRYRGPIPGDTAGFNKQPEVSAADLDADGDVDLAVGSNFSYQIGVLRNSGDGTFDVVESHSASVAIGGLGIWIADFDIDGFVDVTVAGKSLVLLRNDGTGKLASAEYRPHKTVSGSIGNYYGMSAVVVADFDADGRKDLAIAHLGKASVSVLRNLGERRWAPPEELDVEGYAVSLSAHDIDGDGRAELLIMSSPGTGMSILRADESFQFTEVDFLAVADLQGVTAARIDANSPADLLLYVQGFLIPYSRESEGWRAGVSITGIPRGSFRGLVDLDQDGISEILSNGLTDGLVVSRVVDGVATVANFMPEVKPYTNFAQFDDDGDGAMDLLLTTTSSIDRVQLLRGDGQGGLQLVDSGKWDRLKGLDGKMAAQDLNLDGRTDLIVETVAFLNVDATTASLRMRFAAPSLPTNDDPTSSIMAADLDGDGRADLITTNISRVGANALNDAPAGLWITWNDAKATTSADCNLNRSPDSCDVGQTDCNANDIPDDCELDSDGDAVNDDCDSDADGDFVPDDDDECTLDPTKWEAGACGCGSPDDDSDRDGIPDCFDNCPQTSPAYQTDRDRDGVGDLCDACPIDGRKASGDLCDCGVVDSLSDSDGDGVIDCHDACPGVSNQRDSNNNGVADCADLCHPLNGGTISETARGDGNCDQRRSAADLGAIVQTMASNVRSMCGGEDADRNCRATTADIAVLVRMLFAS